MTEFYIDMAFWLIFISLLIAMYWKLSGVDSNMSKMNEVLDRICTRMDEHDKKWAEAEARYDATLNKIGATQKDKL